jgi:hypothetical protein
MNNPFASRRVRPGAIPFQFPHGVDATALVARLSRLGWRGAIIGPHGTGKSTLLAALSPEFARVGRDVRLLSLHDAQRRLPQGFLKGLPAKSPEIVVVDGYEQLNRWSRWRLDRRCRALGSGLLVTAHGPTGLPLLFRTAVDEKLAERIVDHLLGTYGNCPSVIDRDDVRRAWSKHGGNLRETFFDLYDTYQNRAQQSPCQHSPVAW